VGLTHSERAGLPEPDCNTYSISWREDGERKYEHGFADEDAARKRLAIINGDEAAGKPKTVRIHQDH